MSNFSKYFKFEHRFEHQMNFTTPKIYHGGKTFDLSKRWYIYYKFKHPSSGKLIRQDNEYFDFNKYKTVKERLYRINIMRDRMELELKNGFSPYVTLTEEKKFTIEDSLNFCLSLKEKSVSETTYKDYKFRVNQFILYLTNRRLNSSDVSKIKKRHVLGFLNEILINTSSRSRNNAKSSLSAIFTELENQERIEKNFIKSIPSIKSDPTRNKSYEVIKVDEIYKYLEKNDSNLLLFVLFVSYNFLRPIEVVRLKVGDIDFINSRLQVKAKNKALKIKIIPKILMDKLQFLRHQMKDKFIFTPSGVDYCETTEVNRRNYWTKRFRKAVKNPLNIGINQAIYSFRHTFVSILYKELRKQYSVLETEERLMLITGHSTIQALRMYLRDLDAELAVDYSDMISSNLKVV